MTGYPCHRFRFNPYHPFATGILKRNGSKAPGNAADFPAEESFYTFTEQAVCLFTEETNYRSSLSPFGIKMVDRLTGKPLHLDISDLPMKRGITTNRYKFGQ